MEQTQCRNSENLRLERLVADALGEIKRLCYSRRSRGRYRAIWEHLIEFSRRKEWSLAKGELANSCPRDVDELMEDVIRSVNGIRGSRAKLHGCILQSELPLFLR